MNWVFNKLFAGKSAAWTALFTLVLTVATVQLARLARDSNDTEISTQRAVVNVLNNAQATKAIVDGKVHGLNIYALVFNSGSIPAAPVIGGTNTQTWPSAMPSAFNFPDSDDPAKIPFPTVLGPKIGIAAPPVVVSISDLGDIKLRKNHVYIWGWIAYRDGFKKTPPRLTEFCFEVANFKASADQNVLENPANEYTWDQVPCPVQHSCYDESCSDYTEKTKGL